MGNDINNFLKTALYHGQQWPACQQLSVCTVGVNCTCKVHINVTAWKHKRDLIAKYKVKHKRRRFQKTKQVDIVPKRDIIIMWPGSLMG